MLTWDSARGYVSGSQWHCDGGFRWWSILYMCLWLLVCLDVFNFPSSVIPVWIQSFTSLCGPVCTELRIIFRALGYWSVCLESLHHLLTCCLDYMWTHLALVTAPWFLALNIETYLSFLPHCNTENQDFSLCRDVGPELVFSLLLCVCIMAVVKSVPQGWGTALTSLSPQGSIGWIL